MTALSSLSFAYPWVLLVLATLPLLYWFLKVIPPKPRRISFPAIRLLLSLQNKEQSSQSIPPWLLVLRLVLLFLLIITLAGPRLNAGGARTTSGPLVILVDNNWQMSPNWPAAETRIKALLQEAERADRLVSLIPMAATEDSVLPPASPILPAQALDKLGEITPKAVPLDLSQIERLLPAFQKLENPEFAWITARIGEAPEISNVEESLKAIEALGPLTLYTELTSSGPHIVGMPLQENGKFTIPLFREKGSEQAEGVLLGKGGEGKILFRQIYAFDAGQNETSVSILLPTQLTNQLERIEIEHGNSAASIYLLDSRWRRPEIGLVTRASTDTGHMLLDERHYLEKALTPYYTVTKGEISDLLKNDLPFLALPDTGRLPSEIKLRLEEWIKQGGTLIRFAGPHLAASDTDLTPVRLRSGNRNLDGSISWSKPATLGLMPEGSPFAALPLPGDVLIRKQVLAIPSPDLNDKTWARLSDGTPLVTAQKRGQGMIVLFHTTASTAWSNLALSGLFVEMLREIGLQAESRSNELTRSATLPPLSLLDGQGKLLLGSYHQSPLELGPDIKPVVSGLHPAGYYGNEESRYGLNIGADPKIYERFDFKTLKAKMLPLSAAEEINLRPALLSMILILMLLDLLAMIALQGKSVFPRRKQVQGLMSILGITAALLAGIMIKDSTAAETEDRILAATLQTRLAYIMTGDQRIDSLTRAGMTGISQLVTQRTSVEVAEPMAVNIEEHEILFYPFVYWPMTADFPDLSEKSLKKIRDYMANGGTLLIDTRNQIKMGRYGGSLSNSPENIRLQSLMARLDIPRLTPVPVDHVLTRSFYLMQAFPGRYADGEVWIADTTDMIENDGVSPLLIGSNDWAAAWAVNESGRPLAAVTPGGPRQRELARRFGINLVMYTLTGSYKSDQVHIPAILERLGQ